MEVKKKRNENYGDNTHKYAGICKHTNISRSLQDKGTDTYFRDTGQNKKCATRNSLNLFITFKVA